jgi:gag-polypeptide of LTR copia-type
MAPLSDIPNVEYNTTKWGKVVIFNSDNYALFEMSCTMALVASGSWPIVNGEEEEPVARGPLGDFKRRRSIAIQIISSSVAPFYFNDIMPFVRDSDPAGMWKELQKSNRSNDAVYATSIRSQFAMELFDPTKETIRQFVSRLNYYRTQLTMSKDPISEKEILNKLLQSLPASNPIWQQAKNSCIRDDLSLQASILLLQSNESPLPIVSTAAASYTPNGQENNRVGGRGRGRGRTRGRGGRGGNYVSSQNTAGVRKAGKEECSFCLKKGHWMKDCYKFKKAQEAVLKGNKDKDTAKKASRVAGSNEGLIYPATPTEYAL